MGEKIKELQPIEPLLKNRWIINLEGIDIPDYLFRKYKIYNDADNLIFETEFYETVDFTCNLSEIFNVVGVTIKHLDPVGYIVGGYTADVKGTNFIKKCDYSSSKLMTTKLIFTLNTETFKLLNNDTK
jgi:hypothetical protein